MIVREGYPFLFGALVLVALAIAWTGPVGLPLLILPLYVAWFFRNPKRQIPKDDRAIVSPADGRILSIEEVDEGRYLKRRMKRISIFMSPMDVHINRIPVSGKIRGVTYHPGKFFPAFREKTSLDNEQNAVFLETAQGEPILFVQIAGWLARRIVCYLKVGDQVQKGDRYGLIRFGSRLDLYLPMGYEILAHGKVRGGETILARRP